MFNTAYKTHCDYLIKSLQRSGQKTLGKAGHIDVHLSVTLQDNFADVKVRFWGCGQLINMSLGTMQRSDVAVTLQLCCCADHTEVRFDPVVIS